MNAKHILSTLFRNIFWGALIGGGFTSVSGLFGGNTGPDGEPLTLGESLSTGVFIGAIIGGLVALYRLGDEYQKKKESKGFAHPVFEDANRQVGQAMREFNKLNASSDVGAKSSMSKEDNFMGHIAQLQITCKNCGKTTNVFIQETSAPSADVKCEHCRKVFVFSSGMLYNPIGYVSEIPQWARITEEDKE